MDERERIGLLKDEYLLLQKFYEDFDARVIQIKGWSATVGLAAIGGGFYHPRFLWLFASGAALIFWILESLWKSFLYMYGPRIEHIEKAFRSESFGDVAPLQIYASWFERFNKTGFQLFTTMRMGIVWFPHAVTLVAGILPFLLETLGILSIPRS
jgi:hypothetical protein